MPGGIVLADPSNRALHAGYPTRTEPLDPGPRSGNHPGMYMRILLALAVVVVFAALMVFDTAALVRLTAVCATGGCGVPVLWIAGGAGVLALAAVFSLRRQGANVKKARGRKPGRPQPARAKATARSGKAPARSRPKPAK
jgi:hypothetical protein